MTFVVNVEDDRKIEQLLKQLHKQIDVLKVSDITDQGVVARELALIKVLSTGQTRSEITELSNHSVPPFIDVARDSVTVQVTGENVEDRSDHRPPETIRNQRNCKDWNYAFARGNSKSVTDMKQYTIVITY